jgi:cytochrome c oxidase subunit III
MVKAQTWVREQFDSAEQQRHASLLGMWAFLATEIMFFGGLFVGYIVYRHAFPYAFAAASRHTNILYGTLNTAILLTSSLTMALAVHAAEQGRARAIVRNILRTVLLAGCFLGVKALEYTQDFHEHLVPGFSFYKADGPGQELFFYFYWAMTGLHALHVVIGIGVLSVMALFASRGRFNKQYYTPVEVAGLYWHFVDIVWIYLYPLLYLIGRHQ